MALISAVEMDRLQELALLEYEVAQGRLDRTEALARAKTLGLNPRYLDTLEREPGRGGYTEFGPTSVHAGAASSGVLRLRVQASTETDPAVSTPTTRKMADLPFSSVLSKRPLTQAQAESLFREFSSRIGIPVTLDWDSPNTGVWVDVERDRHIEIPGGLVRKRGVYEDTLAVIVAHELSHLEGKHKDEARADYEATRFNLPKLLGPMPAEAFFTRALVGAYSVMLLLGADTSSPEPLQLRSADAPMLSMNLGGYPTLQSRWDLMKAGVIGAPMLEPH